MSRLAFISCSFCQKNELRPVKKAEGEAQRAQEASVSAGKPMRDLHTIMEPEARCKSLLHEGIEPGYLSSTSPHWPASSPEITQGRKEEQEESLPSGVLGIFNLRSGVIPRSD